MDLLPRARRTLYTRAASALGLAFLAAASPAAAQSCEPVPADAVAWWSGGGSALDAAGDHDGVLVGGASFATGIVGQAFFFNGVGSAVVVPHAADFDPPTGAITVEAWIRATGASAVLGGLVTKHETGQKAWAFSRRSDGGLRWAVYHEASGTSRAVDTPAGTIPLGVFHHVAASFDVASQQLAVYVDGAEVPSSLLACCTDDMVSLGGSSADVRIGSFGASMFHFTGLIDEPTIYDRALAASEIQAIFAAGSAGKCSSATWHVPGDFISVQSAINAAASGDTIVVGPGIWPGPNLSWSGKNLTLTSSAGAEQTILDGQNVSRILTVSLGVTTASRIENLTFWRGSAPSGGAIFLASDAAPTIVGCVFRSNRSTNGGTGNTGGNGSASSTVGATGGTGGTGGVGSAGFSGGAVYVQAGAPRFVNCHFWSNLAGDGGKGGTGGWGGQGGPWGLFTDPGKGGHGGLGGSGGPGGLGGAIATDTGSPELVGCVFRANRAGRGGAGGNGGSGGLGGNGPPFGSNGPAGEGGDGRIGTTGARGGAIAVLSSGGGFSVVNCVFRENPPALGGNGGVAGSGSPSGSSGSSGSAGLGSVASALFGSALQLSNSILNANGSVTSDVVWNSGSAPVIAYCVTDHAPYAGAGNFQADPLFANDASDPWLDYRLLPGSPCIDSADVALLPSGITHDPSGAPRRLDDPATVDGPNAGTPPLDIGAAEFTPPASLVAFDCAFNPVGSLNHVSGSASLGGSLGLAIDNPLDTQGVSLAFGIIGFGSFASQANPCGLPLPGFGMAGAGAFAGLAIDPNAALPMTFVGLWNGAPIPWALGLPNSPGLHGLTLTLQAVIAEAAPGAVPIALTRAVQVVLGT